MRLAGPFTSGVAAGADGSATNNATSTDRVTGLLYGLYITYNDSPPAGTTDVTIQAVPLVGPTRTLLTITNAATSGYFSVRVAGVDTANASSGQYDLMPLVNDQIKITIAGANANDYVTVYAYILD